MRLLEIVRGKNTSKEVIATCMQLSKALGMVGVLVGNCRGFVGNRMFHPYRREAQFLVEEGAGIAAVDLALTDFGMAMGPLATGDLAGLDVGWRIRKEYRHLEQPGVRQPVICHPESSEGSWLDPSPAAHRHAHLNLAFIPAFRASGPERSAEKTHPGLGWFCTAPAPLLRHHLVRQLAHHHLA